MIYNECLMRKSNLPSTMLVYYNLSLSKIIFKRYGKSIHVNLPSIYFVKFERERNKIEILFSNYVLFKGFITSCLTIFNSLCSFLVVKIKTRGLGF